MCRLVCPLLCSITDRGKSRALESVWFCPVWSFPADGAVVQDAVRVFFCCCCCLLSGAVGGVLVENSFFSCEEAGAEDEQEPC